MEMGGRNSPFRTKRADIQPGWQSCAFRTAPTPVFRPILPFSPLKICADIGNMWTPGRPRSLPAYHPASRLLALHPQHPPDASDCEPRSALQENSLLLQWQIWSDCRFIIPLFRPDIHNLGEHFHQ